MLKSSFPRLWWPALGLHFALLGPVMAQDEPVRPAPTKAETLSESIRKGDLAAVKAAIEADPKLALSNPRGQPPIYSAIQSGKADIVTYLLENGVDPNADTNYGGGTPLTMAMAGYTENWKPVAEALVAKGAKINGGDNEGQTPLSRAISSGGGNSQKDRIAWLLSKGADINARNRQGRTALEAALYGSSAEIVTLLLDKADIKKTDDNGNTPIFAAVTRGNAEYVRLILDKGADLNVQNVNGDTVLHLAAQNPGPLLKTLLDAGARTNLKNNRGDLPVHIALRRREEGAAYRNPYGYNPYGGEYYEGLRVTTNESATPRGTIIAPLTDKSDINAKDQFGLSPLLLAIVARDQESRDIIIERKPKMDSTTQLFDAVAQGNVAQLTTILKQKPFLVYFRLADGTTPLHVAAQWGTLGAAQFLAQKGGDINARDSRGETPLHEALARPTGLFARRARNMMAFLIEKGADVNALDQNDATALHRAAKSGDADLLTALLAKNVNPNVRDKSGQTPLFALMTKNSDLKLVQALLDKGANINIRSQNSGSLLQSAVATRRKELVQLVLDKGADVNAKDSQGRTALASLLYSGGGNDAAPVAALLLAKGADPNEKIYNESLLYRAISNDAKDIVKLLLDTKKMNLKAVSPERQSPLFQAVTYGRTEIVGMLLDAGADANEKDAQGRSILKVASGRGSKEIADLLRAKGAKDE
jgi:ankyrin repeat protein